MDLESEQEGLELERYICKSSAIVSFGTLGVDVLERGDKEPSTRAYQGLIEEYNFIKKRDKQPPRGERKIGTVIW